MVGCRRMMGLVVAAVAMTAVSPAFAADTLSATGARLESEKLADVTRAVITRTVNLDGDVPTATYVIARGLTNELLQRTNDGYWVPWDSRQSTLIDNKLTVQGGKLVYKVLSEDLSGALFPLSITLAYTAGGTFKYGVFAVEKP